MVGKQITLTTAAPSVELPIVAKESHESAVIARNKQIRVSDNGDRIVLRQITRTTD